MSEANAASVPNDHHPSTPEGLSGPESGLNQVLSGKLGKRYGALPVVAQPQENELLIGFIVTLAFHLKGKGLYRRDRVIMVPDLEAKRLLPMTAKWFCSWSQRHVVTSKEKKTRDGDVYEVMKDMPTEAAEKVLESHEFIVPIPRIDEVHGVPLPKLVEGSPVVLMTEGYDEELRVWSFNL
jgi:hypothetical protein